MTRIIGFSDGNGFPAGTYRVLFEHRVLFERWHAADFAVHAIEKFRPEPYRPHPL